MEGIAYVDLTNKTLTDAPSGSRISIPQHSFGEEITLGLRFMKRVDGTPVEVSKTVQELRASIGRIDERPESGQWGFTVDPVGSDTDVTGLDHDLTAAELKAALDAASLGLGTVSVEKKSGSWLVEFSSEDTTTVVNPVTIDATATNSLFPDAFIRHRTFAKNGQWVHEFRLIQTPVAFTDSSSRQLPAEPTITAFQDGGTDADVEFNEIQKLVVPAEFRGLYQIRKGSAKTKVLYVADGVDEIKETLNNEIAQNDEEFDVYLGIDDEALIEFKGDFEGANQDLLTIQIYSAPEGDLTFTLDLNTAELFTLLRREPEVTLPFEIEADIEDDDDALIVYTRKLYSGEITINRGLIYEELAVAQNIDWLRPPLAEQYGGFDYSAVSNGQLHYSSTEGDGTSNPITIDHNLDVDHVDVIVKEISTGDILILGTSYTVNVTNSNSLTVTPTAPVASNDWRVTVLGLEQTSYFDSHTHPISDITNLQATLDGLGTRVTDLETLAGVNAVQANFDSSGSSIVCAEWRLPPVFEVYPARSAVTDVTRLVDINLDTLERPRGLLPAVHDAATESLPDPVPAAAAAYQGRVFVSTADGVRLPGGKGIRSTEIDTGEYAACDGEVWYQVVNYEGESVSFYPKAFERELFRLHINERQLRVGKRLDLRFALEMAVLNANTNGAWTLVIEKGTKGDAATPVGVGVNLDQITWDSTPMFEQDIVVTPVSTVHRFGMWVDRASGGITATALAYGASEAAASAPSTANFAIRARLIRWDTEDNQSDPEGFAALKGFTLDGDIETAEPEFEGFAYIR